MNFTIRWHGSCFGHGAIPYLYINIMLALSAVC